MVIFHEKLSPIMAISQKCISNFYTNHHNHHQQMMANRNHKRYGICGSPSNYEFAYFETSPIQVWLNELQSLTEVESLSALQAKSVATTPESFEALSIRNAQISIQQIRHNSIIIIDELDLLIDTLPNVYNCDLNIINFLYEKFFHTYEKIQSLIDICKRKGCDYHQINMPSNMDNNNKQLSSNVLIICEQIIKLMRNNLQQQRSTNFHNYDNCNYNDNTAQIECNIRKLKENFGQLVDVTIKKESMILVSSLNRKTSHLCLKWSLLALWQLTQNDPYMCRLFIDNQKIINYLLNILENNYNNYYFNITPNETKQIKAATLRVLTYLSSNHNAIYQIFNEFQINKKILSTILSFDNDMVLQKEMIAFLVQITTIFIDNSNKLSSEFDYKLLINELVNGLTLIIKKLADNNNDDNENEQIFLMCCATLANISFISIDVLMKYDILSLIMNESRKYFERFENEINCDQSQTNTKALSSLLLLKDQIITLLANMSQKYHLIVVSSGGLIFLIQTLLNTTTLNNMIDHHQQPKTIQLSIERIQQKISVALARLGTNKSTAKIIYKLNGVKRLIQLCKEPKERNYSDTVLLATIAAIKRISQSIGRLPFKELNAIDLIDLKLQDIFMKYSIKNESLV